MKKKIVMSIIAICLAAMCFCACVPQKGIVFDGAVSKESYGTVEAAAIAFLKEELGSEETSIELKSYVKDVDLSEKEIKALPLGEISASDITHAEKGTVTYSERAGDEKTYEIYILQIGDEYKYLTLAAKAGVPITKSEYDAIWDYGNFKNCTIEETISVIDSFDHIEREFKFVAKFTEDAAEYLLEGFEVDRPDEILYQYAYYSIVNNDVYRFIKNEDWEISGWKGERMTLSTGDEDDLTNKLKAILSQEAIDGFFLSSEDGGVYNVPSNFLLKEYDENKKNELFVNDKNKEKALIAHLLDLSPEKITQLEEEEGLKFQGEYSLLLNKNGKADFETAYAHDENNNYKISWQRKFGDYGKTTVTLPDDLKEYIEENIGTNK